MKKLIIIIVILFTTNVYSAQVNYTIPDNKINEFVADFIYIYPNTEREVKDGVDPQGIPEGTPISDDTWYQDKWTNKEWTQERIRRWAKDQVNRSRKKQGRDAVTIIDADSEIQ